MGTVEDVNAAVVAARKAFGASGYSSREERLEMLRRVLKLFDERAEEFAQLTTLEMGAPITFARQAQIAGSRAHIATPFAFSNTTSSSANPMRPISFSPENEE